MSEAKNPQIISTTCKICNALIPLNPTDALFDLAAGSGQKMTYEQRRTAAQVLGLAQHLIDKHPRLDSDLQLNAGAYLGMLRLMQFKTHDKAMLDQRDRARWEVFQRLISVSSNISDTNIQVKAGETADHLLEIIEDQLPDGFDRKTIREKFAEHIRQLVTGVRDGLHERDRYKVSTAGANPLAVLKG